MRFLPHWHPQDKWIFITWRLAGSQPQIPDMLTADLPEGKRFALLDQEADRATTGPLWLTDPRIAQVVQDKILSGAPELYDLAAWAIMANHVHIVILPRIPMGKIMQQVKGVTAYAVNQILNRTGQPFWAIESYDHWIRNDDELNRVIRYVERNPEKAGLVDYPWRSRNTDFSLCPSPTD